MRHFAYKNGELHAENVPLRLIANEVGTPVYVYSTATFERHYTVFANAFSGLKTLIAYSVKANSNIAILSTLARLGSGADVVSGGELARALIAGIPAQKIVFSGVGKSRAEMEAALKANIRAFNVESLAELEALNEVALSCHQKAPVAFRLNPDIRAGGHDKITTGQADNKFGIAWNEAEAAYAKAAQMPGIEIVGIDLHLGSQIDKLAPFERAITKAGALIKRLRDLGHTITSFDLGGGLGIPYGNTTENPPLPSEYGQMVRRLTQGLDVELIFEPGRMIAGNAGILLSQVLYVKKGGSRTFLIIDAAMNDLLRPALYDAWHDIEPVNKPQSTTGLIEYDVVGPICESGDTFAMQRPLPKMDAHDLLVFHSAGAYGASQSSQYNSRPLIPEVLVRGDQFDIIRERPTLSEMLKAEHIPSWLSEP